MEQRLANLEVRDQLMASSAATPPPLMQAPATLASSSAPLANNSAPYAHPAKDPSETIKTSEVPKFDGKKEVEAWIIEFKKYCRLLKIRSNEDILLAVGIAMIDEAGYLLERQEANLTTWGPCLYLHAVGPGNFWSACQMLTETGGRGEGFRYVWFPPAAAFGM